MKKFKRFILLVQTSLDGKIIQRANYAKSVVEPNCHECSASKQCPMHDKWSCPMRNLVGISSSILYVTDADDYRSIRKKAIDLVYLLPMVEMMLLIDTRDKIGYIYKADGALDEIKRGLLLADVLKHYKRCTKASETPQIADARDKLPLPFGTN